MLSIDLENVPKRLKWRTCLKLNLLVPLLQQHLLPKHDNVLVNVVVVVIIHNQQSKWYVLKERESSEAKRVED